MKSGSNRFSTEEKWVTAGAIVQGALHIRQDKPCQDALGFSQVRPDFAIACVADGHGSASCPYSAEGAYEAVRLTCELLKEIMLQEPVDEALATLSASKDIRLPKQIETKWKQVVEEIHLQKEREEPFSSVLYGATLLAVLATDTFLFALQIGDGDIILVDGNAKERHVFPDSVVSIGEDTESLCLKDAWQHVRTTLIPWDISQGSPMVMLSTDGYANSFAEGAGLLKAGVDIYNLWQTEGVEYLNENLPDWLRKSSDVGSGDDIALALIMRNRGKVL